MQKEVQHVIPNKLIYSKKYVLFKVTKFSECCLALTQQFFSHIMARTS